MLIPDHETAVDFLNYAAIAETVVAFLSENRERAMTIGIHGDWGAGKSSVLKMIESELAGDDDVAVLWFNGWAFQGFDDAKTVLIEATITELCRRRSTTGKVKELGAKLIRRVDWLKLARRGAGLAFTVGTGIPSPDMIDAATRGLQTAAENVKDWTPEQMEVHLSEAKSFLRPAEGQSIPKVIHDFRIEFEKLLKEAKIKQLIVLIDDLDRCLPATAIDTLEAIRLFLFVPYTAFVIGADEQMIEYAVRQHFPDLPLTTGPLPYVRNYLEKLVQVPFRIPSLGIQETRTYVTLLLVGGLVGEEDEGFRALLDKARNSLNRPWLGAEIKQADVQAVASTRKEELVAVYVLAQQIGPILAEGTKGNPRQVKRFLNALLVRQAIASARGFGNDVNQAVLGKLMLAERFLSDLYEHIAGKAMQSKDGKVPEIKLLEDRVRKTKSKKAKARSREKALEPVDEIEEDVQKWLEQDWVRRWLLINPLLGETDLRPYVFVAQDKRTMRIAAPTDRLDDLIEKLSASKLAVRSVEAEVKALTPAEAEQVFAALHERVVRFGSYKTEPPGFEGMSVVAKHHARFQFEILTLLRSIDSKELGIWVVKGWNEIITDDGAKNQLIELLNRWAKLDGDAKLGTAAGQALSGLHRRKG